MENNIDIVSEVIAKIENNLKYENKNSDYLFSNQDKYQIFINWLKDNKVIYEDNLIYPVSYGKYNIIGAKAKRDINKNEALFYIPKKLIIDSIHLRALEEFKSMFIDFPELENLNVLIITIYLIKEYNNPESFWKPYLDLIYAEVPILWANELLMELDDEVLIEAIIEHKKDLIEYYSLLVKFKIIDSNKIDINLFMTYYSFVLSRNFCVSENQLLIVPFADSLNHNQVNVKYECFDSNNYVCKFTKEFDDSIVLNKTDNNLFYNNIKKIKADEDCLLNTFDTEDDEEKNKEDEEIILKFNDKDYFLISTGNAQKYFQTEQVYNFYGQYSNEYLLKWYGFCYFNNKYDYIAITLHLPKYEDLEFDKFLDNFFKDFLNESESQNKFFNSLKFKLKANKINLDYLNYMRFFYFYETDEFVKFINYKFDIHVEMEILNRSIEILQVSLNKKSMNYTLENDLKLLNKIYSDNLQNKEVLKEMRLVNILIFRITQKLIIIKQINMIRKIIQILQESLEEYISGNVSDSNILFKIINTNYNFNLHKADFSLFGIKKYFIKNKLAD